MPDMLTGNSALLDLLLTNQDDILDHITTNVILGYSNHSIVEFKILLSTLKTSSRTKTLDFRRANFNMLRAQLQGMPWEASLGSTEGKGACECWELFQNSLLKAQEQSIPYRGNGRRQNKRPPWLNKEFWVPSRPGLSGMAERPPSVPRLAWVEEEEEEGAGAAPAWQPDEVEEVQPLQADPVCDLPEVQEDACALFRSRAQMFWESLEPTEREDTTIMAIQDMADSDSYNAEDCAAMLDVLVERDTSNLEHVPSIVKCIYRWLTSNTDVSAEHRLDKALLKLTREHPHDVVVTLLHCAPSCDRAAGTMWRAMVSMSTTAENVLQELLCVLKDWPLLSTSTCDGDKKDVFALAATRALWEILQPPRCLQKLKEHFPRFFLALLFQILFSTEQMPEEVNTFWRGCQQEGCLPTNPNRFAVLTVKALLCRLGYEVVVFDVERKRGWDTLLNAETHHYAMGLLAREMCGVSKKLRYAMSHCLVELLSEEEPRWDVSAMAFLVELLAYRGMKVWIDRMLPLVPRYLQSESRVMHRVVLRGLITLCKRPVMAKRMQFLLPRLMELLQDADGEVVEMTICVISKVVRALGIPIASSIALQLAERLLPLFDNDINFVQLLSIYLFRDVMEFVAEAGKKPLKTHVHQSLLPLLCHLHDENQRVAEASRKTLLEALRFLKKRKLEQLLEREQTWAVGECLLAEHSSRAEEYLYQCLRYLESPQESLREASIRIIALQGMGDDISLSISSLASQTLFVVRAAERNPPSRLQELQVQLRTAWRRRPALQDNGCLCCCSSVQT